MRNKICIGCKQKFKTNVIQKKYCSEKCKEKNRGTIKVCMNCKNEFIGREQRLFCGAVCFGLFHKEKIIDRNIRNRKYPHIDGLTRQQVFWRYNPECKIKTLKRDRDKRYKVIKHLGNKCSKCGYDKDIRALVLDHVNGDGKKDRKEKGSRISRYYIKHLNEAKEKLQVLCSNCNAIKSFENNEHNISRRIDKKDYNFLLTKKQ